MYALSVDESQSLLPRAFAAIEAIVPSNQPLAVAVSGGADSMALALLMQAWKKNSFTALIVDHGLRAESAGEAVTVKTWLNQRNISAVILKGEPIPAGSGVQEKARDYRYRLMLGWCLAHDVKHLLLAHHADDQRETILMRLIRGSGVDGLAGMKPVAMRESVTLLRPLLGIAKRELVTYLRKQNQGWVNDPTNGSDTYTRTRIRAQNKAFEEEGLSPERLQLIHENLSRTSDYLAEQTFNHILSYGELNEAGFAWIALDALHVAHEEIQLRTLKKMIAFVNGGSSEPRYEELKRLLDNVSEEKFAGATLAHVEFIVKAGQLYAIREFSRMKPVTVKAGSHVLFDERFGCSVALDEAGGEYHLAPLGKSYLALPPEVLKRHEDVPKKLLMTLPSLFHLEAPVAVPHMHWSKEKRYSHAIAITYLPAGTHEKACREQN
ncbi:MAG: tRNA lysidine(34) synthetase TilS [Rickettsiales bacterium]